MAEVLDLAAVFDRHTVKMPDGTTYALRNPQELGIVDEHRLRALLNSINDFNDRKADASEEEAEQASGMLRDLAAMIVVDCPVDIPDWACAAVFQFWMERAQTVDPRKPRRRTTAASSRGSKRSTAATHSIGSTSRSGR